MRVLFCLLIAITLLSCTAATKKVTGSDADTSAIKPVVVTEKVLDDSDDPAIWINPVNRDSSLIIGTDKNKVNGSVYSFHLNGKTDRQRTVTGLKRVNNVDIAYGLMINNKFTDIAVVTERDRNVIRVFSLPGMKLIDNGGIPVFVGEQEHAPMGIALYTRPIDNAVFAIVSRKYGPAEGHLEQYLLQGNNNGIVTGKLVRKFGKFSGKKEIESIAVDNELGYVYYSDEQTGIRKYYADPAKGNEELTLFCRANTKKTTKAFPFINSTMVPAIL